MKKTYYHSSLALAGLLAVACGVEGDQHSPAWSANAALLRAHDALLDQDYAAVTRAAEDALRAKALAPFEADNLHRLLDEAYAEEAGRLPTNWRLPPEVKELAIESLLARRLGETEEYELRLLAATGSASDLERAELINATGEVVLDSKRDRVEREVEGAQVQTWVIQPRQAAPVRSGLYRIRLHLRSGRVSEGEVVLPDLRSSGTPIVEAVGEVADPRPHLRFQLPSLAERREFERVSLVAYVGTWVQDRKPEWQTEWVMSTERLDLRDVQLGDATLGEGATALAPGRYHAGVTLRMDRSWGPVTIRRMVRTAQRLVVK